MNFAVVSSISSPSALNLAAALADEHLRLVDREGVHEHQHLAQVVLHARGAHGPGLAPMIATGLPSNGGSGGRDIQSSVFFNTPGIEKLYSGVTSSTASAARICALSAITAVGSRRPHVVVVQGMAADVRDLDRSRLRAPASARHAAPWSCRSLAQAAGNAENSSLSFWK